MTRTINNTLAALVAVLVSAATILPLVTVPAAHAAAPGRAAIILA